MKKEIIGLIFIFSLSLHGFSQDIGENSGTGFSKSQPEKEMIDQADIFFRDENFLLALPLYLTLSEAYPENASLKFRAGICYLYKSDAPEKSLEFLKQAKELQLNDPELPLYLGRAYHLNYLFDEAVNEFNLFLKSNPEKKQEQEALHYIEYCKTAKELIATPVEVKITNIGEPINTSGAEYVPVISSDEALMIFTYRGPRSTGGLQNISNAEDSQQQYYEDIFYSNKIGDKWMEPDGIGENINTNEHDAAIAVSADGQKLFIFKSTAKDGGDIYMSHLDGNLWSKPEHLDNNVNTKYWEGSCSLSADEKLLYFSSERPGGFGGKDIYTAEKMKDGTWGNVKNLGVVINTPYDEDAPFIQPDGSMLHFSSKGHRSMGGYDIFRSFMEKDGNWSYPQNIGYPINTVAEDIYYVISADGTRGYYASGKAGGYGMQDIYIALPGIMGKKSTSVLVKGTVTLNDRPVKAEIVVTYADEERDFGICNSNSATGKYLVNIPAGRNYKLTFKVPEVKEEQVRTLNIPSVDFSTEEQIDIAFYTKKAEPVKNKLNALNDDGSILTTAEQMDDSSFIFNELPPDENRRFRLEGENVEFINKLYAMITGAKRTLVRGNDRLFRFELLPVDKSTLDTISTADTAIKLKTSDTTLTASEIIQRFGNYKAEELWFKVQVAAYINAPNFNYSHLKLLGEVENKKYDDSITRFTMGSFPTLIEAENFRKKVIELGGLTTDAFVIAIYKGKRVLMKDLVKENFYNPK